MGTMVCLHTHRLTLHHCHTLQANSDFHISLPGHSLQVHTFRISSKDNIIRTPRNRTILFRLLNMPSLLLKLGSCSRPSKCRPRIHHEFTPRQPHYRNTPKCRRPQAIDSFSSLVGCMCKPPELEDQARHVCTR
jgi:hypothetical protein